MDPCWLVEEVWIVGSWIAQCTKPVIAACCPWEAGKVQISRRWVGRILYARRGRKPWWCNSPKLKGCRIFISRTHLGQATYNKCFLYILEQLYMYSVSDSELVMTCLTCDRYYVNSHNGLQKPKRGRSAWTVKKSREEAPRAANTCQERGI